MSASVHPFPDRFDEGGQRWEPWISEEVLANHFSVSRRTVRRWQDAGMPSKLFGSSRRYQITTCEQWHERRAS